MKRRRILASLLALVLVMSNVGVNLVTSWASQGGLVFRLDDDGTVLPAEKESSEGDEDPADSEEDNYDYLLSLLRNKETGELETYTTDTLGAELLGSRGLPGDLPGTWSGDNDEALTVYPDGSADVLDEGYVTVVFRYEPEETLPQEASEAESSSAPEETEAPKATDNDADEETAAVPETEDAETEPVEAESAPAEETTAPAETAAETTAAVETESAAETVAAAETAASEAGESETEATAPAETESAEETAAAAETTAPEESKPETEAAPENAPDLTDEIPLEAGEELSWVVKVYVDGPKLLALDDIADFAGLKAAVEGAGDGDELTITAREPITVTETLTINKDLTIKNGELNRENNTTTIFVINSGNVVFDSIEFDGGGEDTKADAYSSVIPVSPIVVSANAELTMNNVTVRGFVAQNGGGLKVEGGHVIMNGGSINNNKAKGSSENHGGGVWVQGGCFEMNNADISENIAGSASKGGEGPSSSSTYGGAICIESGYMIMKGNSTIENNIAFGLAGIYAGGIYIDSKAESQLISGCISGNRSYTIDPYMPWKGESGGIGGGIYVHNGKTLVLNSVAVYDNNVLSGSQMGGNIWFCDNGHGQFYSTSGGLITAGKAEYKGDDFFSSEAWPSSKEDLHLSSRLYDGTPIVWYEDNSPRYDESSKPIDDLNKFFAEKAEDTVALHSETTGNAADEYYKLIITGNSAGEGGGIACNGTLIVGEDKDLQLKVTKKWDNSSDETVQIPESLTVSLIRIDKGANSEPQEVDKAVLNEQNSWTYTFEDLSAEYDWTVEEESLPEGWKQQEKGEKNIYDIDGTLRTIEITLTNVIAEPEPETVSVTVNKGWSDAGYEANRPASVTVQLMRDGEHVGNAFTGRGLDL